MPHLFNCSMVKILPAVVLWFMTAIATGQDKVQEIEKLMNLYTEYNKFNGSVLVAENGKVIYKNGHGLANMEFDIPNRPDTKHRIGSLTKQFTAALILQLVEQEKLALGVPISKYLPEYPKPAGDKITLHHLLTHSSGIPDYTSFPGFFEEHSRNPGSPEKFLSIYSNAPLDFQPGEKFEYSNSGYHLLGVIIEKATGRSFEQVLKDQILVPLGMQNTGYDHHKTIIKNRASGYVQSSSGYLNAPYLDMSLPYAAGSMYSTVEDLYLWNQALEENKVLSIESKQKMLSAQIADGPGYYGYGWNIRHLPMGSESLLIQAHEGGINGFNSFLMRIPRDQHLVVLLHNTGGTDLTEISMSISRILYDLDHEKPTRSIARSLFPVFMEQGVEAGLALFEQYKNSDSYSLNENEMNSLGYSLLSANKIPEAIEVFKINVGAFPDSGNAYDSLGEAYLSAGDTENAMLYYRKAVELDPHNANGRAILKELEKK